jgi:hypothetical protein
MRLLSLLALIFLFNTAFMPVLGAAHERSHQVREGTAQITWSDDQSSSGLFQVVHDEHHAQAGSTNASDHSGDHQCHHVSVIGIVSFMGQQVSRNQHFHTAVEQHFLIESFISRIDYPPKNT